MKDLQIDVLRTKSGYKIYIFWIFGKKISKDYTDLILFYFWTDIQLIIVVSVNFCSSPVPGGQSSDLWCHQWAQEKKRKTVCEMWEHCFADDVLCCL